MRYTFVYHHYISKLLRQIAVKPPNTHFYMTFLLLISSIFFQMDTAPFANHRMVLVFGNNTILVQRQLAAFQKDSIGLAERHLIVKQVKPGEYLYKSYQIKLDEPFTVILIGKDGGEKYRSNSILDVDRLFAMVDAMPMRQAEMRQTKDQKNQ